MSPKRHVNWRSRLATFMQARRGEPFEWGVHDCALFVADAALAITNVDMSAQLERGYSNRFGALRSLRRAGYRNLTEYVDAYLPRAERPRAGDIGQMQYPGDPLAPLVLIERAENCWMFRPRASDGRGVLTLMPIPARHMLFWRLG